jgi:DNA repair protein RadD
VAKPTNTVIDVSGVGLDNNGEFKKGELAKAVDKDEITYGAVKETCELAYDRNCWLTFGASIENVEHITSMFQSFGISSVAVHSGYSSDENRERIKAFKRGEFRNLVNMNKFTTGFNHPPIDLIADLQPTTSPGKHVQKGGRGTRPSPSTGKTNCLYLDFARNTVRNGPINDPRIPNKPGKGTGDVPVRICDRCGTYNHAAVRFCGGGSSAEEGIFRGGCGLAFEFETKIFATASDIAPLASDAPIVEYFNVQRVLYNKHQKFDKDGNEISKPSIKVSYFCGLQMFNEWITLQHGGMAGKRARDWWRQRHAEEPPLTTDEALARTRELKIPARIRVWVNKKYPEVLGYEY